mmetsp:Transcript_12034/g.28089  ORF Transcript_12034/g.28089 Transcript_12034/m.28089 type:complete len:414 (-) Transcript_12034:141-1382(-)
MSLAFPKPPLQPLCLPPPRLRRRLPSRKLLSQPLNLPPQAPVPPRARGPPAARRRGGGLLGCGLFLVIYVFFFLSIHLFFAEKTAFFSGFFDLQCFFSPSGVDEAALLQPLGGAVGGAPHGLLRLPQEHPQAVHLDLLLGHSLSHLDHVFLVLLAPYPHARRRLHLCLCVCDNGRGVPPSVLHLARKPHHETLHLRPYPVHLGHFAHFFLEGDDGLISPPLKDPQVPRLHLHLHRKRVPLAGRALMRGHQSAGGARRVRRGGPPAHGAPRRDRLGRGASAGFARMHTPRHTAGTPHDGPRIVQRPAGRTPARGARTRAAARGEERVTDATQTQACSGSRRTRRCATCPHTSPPRSRPRAPPRRQPAWPPRSPSPPAPPTGASSPRGVGGPGRERWRSLRRLAWAALASLSETP